MSKKKQDNMDKDPAGTPSARPAQSPSGPDAPPTANKPEANAPDAADPAGGTQSQGAKAADTDESGAKSALIIERKANKSKKSIAPPLFIIVLLLVTWTGIGAYLLWKHQLGLQAMLIGQAEQARQLAEQTEAAQQQGGQLAERLDRAEAQLGQVITTDLEEVQAQQASIEGLIDTLRDKVERNSQVWITNEAAYLMRLANDRLRLDLDLATTIAALQTADQRLEEFNDPSLFEVRRALAEELAQLRNIDMPDTTGLALQVSALADGVEGLPFASEPAPETPADTAPAEGGFRQAMAGLWQELKKLVVIKQKNASDPALMAPDERNVLKHNLRLTLETARLAAIRRDTSLFHDSLRRAQEWILLYFDTEAAPTKGTLKQLEELQGMNLRPAMPDISDSLHALEAWQAQRRNKKSGGVTP